MYGNQGLLKLLHGGLLQRKLAINEPGDRFEQEADRNADAVMRMTDERMSHEVAQRGPGSQGSRVLQRKCEPAPKSRAEFLKVTGKTPPDAPLGLTTLKTEDVTYPDVELVESPGKKPGARPAWTLRQANPSLPDEIPSYYTAAGVFNEKLAHEAIAVGEPCKGTFSEGRYLIGSEAADLVRQGELEHCADFDYAFQISLAKFAAAVNEIAGKQHCSDAREKCEERFGKQLTKKTGVEPGRWPNVFECLVTKSQFIRDVTKQWHNPKSKQEFLPDCTAVRVRVTGLQDLGHKPEEIIKDCGLPETAAAGKKSSQASPAARPSKATPNPGLQRCSCDTSSAGASCAECKSRTENLQREATSSAAAGFAPPIVHEALGSPGHPLDPTTRSFMEPRLGRDLSSVRVHTGALAAESALAVNATAYTVHEDIVFGDGQYAPHTDAGKRLLAHELTHVMQQADTSAPALSLQREVQEAPFPGGGKVDDVRSGEHLIWNFEIGQHILRAGHKAQMPRIAAEVKGALARDANAKVDVEGQASLTGTQQRNDTLSEERAQAVKDALVKEGVAADRINVIAVGSLKSKPGFSQEDLARGRAVRVIVPPHLLLPTGPNPPAPQTGVCQGKLATDLTLSGAKVEKHLIGPLQKMVAGDGTGNPPGMLISAGAAISPPGCGKFVFVQNVQVFRQFVYKDHTRNTLQSSNFVLDTSDPYPSQDFGPSPGVSVPTANDSPSQAFIPPGEEVINTVEARDDFRMFLLFQPQGGTRSVVQVAEWSWVGQLKNTKPADPQDGVLVIDTSASQVTPSNGKGRPTSDTPVLSPNVTSLDWVTDNGGDPSPDTFANIDRPGLNRRKPKADSK
jgi:outer membrane protein OmpA-like peptidoglycan-associated protein